MGLPGIDPRTELGLEDKEAAGDFGTGDLDRGEVEGVFDRLFP